MTSVFILHGAEAADIPPQGGSADAELSGCQGLVVSTLGQCLAYHHQGHILQCAGGNGRLRYGSLGGLKPPCSLTRDDLSHIVGMDISKGRDGGKLIQHPLQLGIIARPVIFAHELQRIGIQACKALALLCDQVLKVLL